MTMTLTTHDVTWSRKDSFCKDQYATHQEEEKPTQAVSTTIKQLSAAPADPGYSKYNFEEACK